MELTSAGRATLMRIFVDEADRSDKGPLYAAIIEELRRNGFAGATVLKGIEGFGAHREVHAARSVDYASNLPVVVEVAETEEKIQAIVPVLCAMIPEGLITLERITMRLIGKAP
ncbi:MAG TPA: DUF190 domain-containing protein [Candidatus Baltobacteraceae bacterium]